MPTATAMPGGVGVEGERLVAVLEHAVAALALLATLPTPETSVSFAAFVSAANESDERLYCGEHLTSEVEAMLAAHFRLEASLVRAASERQQRRASAAETRRTRRLPKATTWVDHERPEVDDAPVEDGYDEDEGTGGQDDDGEIDGEEEEEDDDDGWDHDDALSFPRSLHTVLQLLTHDKHTRDALRRLSATRISPDAAAFVHCLTDLSMLCERALATTPDQVERQQHALRDASQRLVELHGDAAQLRFELAAERAARQNHALVHVKTISQLRDQLAETQRHANEALRATQRSREQDAQALRAQFETEKVRVHEKMLALERVETRVADAHQADEGDDRKRVGRAVADLHDLLVKYDDEMAALEQEIARETDKLLDQASDVGRLATYFERVDEDRQNQLEEQRVREEQEARKRRRDLNLFKFTTRLQAIVRGFLTRRRVRLEEQLQKLKRKKKKGKKKTSGKNTTKSSTRSATRAPGKPASPRRPTAAASSKRPSSAAARTSRS